MDASSCVIDLIAIERDPNILWPLHKSDNAVEIMHAAANRIYELTEKGERK